MDRLLDRMQWSDDRLVIAPWVFRLEARADDAVWDDGGDEAFVFYKTRLLVDMLSRFWATRPDFRADRILELGLWKGGSLPFWREWFRPKIHIGLDLAERRDSPYFRRYAAAVAPETHIRTYWGVDQGDRERLRVIVGREFDEPLDLVIDDASHMYAATKASFETLFPLLRPHGLYVIEDWAWGHWRGWDEPEHPWAHERRLTDLVFELVEAAGSAWPPLVGSVTVHQGFAVAERGEAAAPDPFALADVIIRRPQDRGRT
jgi:SAM-dependent methyltransferase